MVNEAPSGDAGRPCLAPRPLEAAPQERTALENLTGQRYQTYRPLVRVRQRRARRYVIVVEPMYPGYPYVRLGEGADDRRPICSTIGVSGLR